MESEEDKMKNICSFVAEEIGKFLEANNFINILNDDEDVFFDNNIDYTKDNGYSLIYEDLKTEFSIYEHNGSLFQIKYLRWELPPYVKTKNSLFKKMDSGYYIICGSIENVKIEYKYNEITGEPKLKMVEFKPTLEYKLLPAY